jgi:hypothetical protein
MIVMCNRFEIWASLLRNNYFELVFDTNWCFTVKSNANTFES